MSEEELMERLEPPDSSPVIRPDGQALEEGIPEYLVWPAPPPTFALADYGPATIMDFGESFFFGDPPDTLHTPLVVRPPEVIFEEPFDHRIDLWTTGCLVSLTLPCNTSLTELILCVRYSSLSLVSPHLIAL